MLKASTLLLCALCAAGLKIGATQSVVGEEITVNGRVVFLGFDWVNASSAAAQCTEKGMELISFEDASEYLDLLNVLFTKDDYLYQSFWASGYRRAGETAWYWSSTNQIFTGTFWAAKEPDVSLEKDACLQFYVDPFGNESQWHDEECDGGEGEWKNTRFICE